MTQVNMTAVSCNRMNENDAVQWIYHSPHLRLFLAYVMECHRLYPYLSDLGLAINIMRPAKSAQTALGFHFDSIDSSRSKNGEGTQPKGATGVIGIQDCDEGGERIVFPTVNRNNVESVDMILKKYDPLRPGKIIGPLKPSVFRQATRGMFTFLTVATYFMVSHPFAKALESQLCLCFRKSALMNQKKAKHHPTFLR